MGEDDVTIRDANNAESYAWGAGGIASVLWESADLSVKLETLQQGCAEMMHRHGSTRQVFVILAGQATLRTERGVFELCEGQAVAVPPGVSHSIGNRASEPARILVCSSAPPGLDRIEDSKSG